MQADNDKALNIFLVDDDADEHELFKDAIQRVYTKAIVTSIKSCELLTDHLITRAQSIPDIVFLDVNMPRQNGIECLLDIRREKRLDVLPVVMYTNSARPEDIIAAYTNGANIFITKPLSYRDEIVLIKKILTFYYRQLF
jgi:CheY-like chemotaxis protein